MRTLRAHYSSQSKGRWQTAVRRGVLLLTLIVVFPPPGWSQDQSLFAAGVKVLAALESTAYDWSPDGQRLAYATDDGIWIVQAPDFRRPTQLIRKGRGRRAQPVTQVQWSPNGQKLAFVGSRPGDDWDTIWVTNMDGSHVRDLLPPGAPFVSPGTRSIGISIWPNNQELAFTQHCGTGCLILHKVDLESRDYWSFCVAREGNFYWAPTKKRVLVNSHYSAFSEGGLGVVDAESATQVFEVSSYLSSKDFCRTALQGCIAGEEKARGEDYGFDGWSPDGKHVLFTGWACEERPIVGSVVTLHLWQVGSGHEETLLPHAGWAAWSPDESKIAFLLFGEPRYDESRHIIGTDFTPGRPFRLYLGIMKAATHTVSTLILLGNETVRPEKILDWELFRPLWSPTGEQLVARNVQGELFVVGTDGSDCRRITTDLRAKAKWSPNGKHLALWRLRRYTSHQDPQEVEGSLSSLYIVDVPE